MRRILLYVFNQRYIRKSRATRTGECKRCGACCHLVASKCGWLTQNLDTTTSCRIYKYRCTPICWIFPIDARDIADRNLVAPPDVPCGFSFPSA
jgi:hypothetical protein